MPDNKRVNIIKTNTQMRALGFGVLGNLGLFLIAQICFFRHMFLHKNLAYNYLYAKIERKSLYLNKYLYKCIWIFTFFTFYNFYILKIFI